MPRPSFLSKSKLMSARQCVKRLYLEVHRKDLLVYSAATEAAFRRGHQVGAIARVIYGGDASVFIPYEGGLKHALAKTRRLLHADRSVPVFEATLQHHGLLVRLDALIPDGDGWRIVEVKASARLKPEHAFDCAIQAWVFRRSGYRLKDVSLAHIDTEFVYNGDGDYAGLLREEDINDDVEALLPSVGEWISDARAVLAGDEPSINVGKQCFSPYECPFVNHCWPQDTEYPVLGLGGRATRDMLGQLVAEGFTDVRDIPADRLNDTQLRIQRVSRAGTAEVLPGAADHIDSLGWPRYYLDFETVSSAVPLWPDTRPYEQLPFQWSCHFETEAGALTHADFLDLTGEAPMRRFAESLIRVLGSEGPIIVYSGFEAARLRRLIERFPDLGVPLQQIIDRLEDLLIVTRACYYHPQMRGSWSIKSVLPTVAADLSYEALGEVSDGTAAAEAYVEAIDGATSSQRKEELRIQLLEYCRFDTFALVRLARFLAQAPPTAG